MPFIPITVSAASPSSGIYSPAVRVGNLIYTSGMVAIDDSGKTVGVGDIRMQTRHIFEQIRKVIEAAGGQMSDIFMNHIFLKEFADYASMNEEYRRYFPDNPPARYCVQANLVKSEWLIEIMSIAAL